MKNLKFTAIYFYLYLLTVYASIVIFWFYILLFLLWKVNDFKKT